MSSHRDFDLKLASGQVVRWSGSDGEDAARNYVDCHRKQTVVAWREPVETSGVFVWGGARIIEPGDKE